MGQKVIIRF